MAPMERLAQWPAPSTAPSTSSSTRITTSSIADLGNNFPDDGTPNTNQIPLNNNVIPRQTSVAMTQERFTLLQAFQALLESGTQPQQPGIRLWQRRRCFSSLVEFRSTRPATIFLRTTVNQVIREVPIATATD